MSVAPKTPQIELYLMSLADEVRCSGLLVAIGREVPRLRVGLNQLTIFQNALFFKFGTKIGIMAAFS